MTYSADHAEIAEQARRIYAEQLVKGLPAMVNSLAATASALLDKPSEHARFMRRRELVHELKKGAAVWHKTMVNSLRNALLNGVSAVRPGDLPPPAAASGPLSLVDDDTIEREILTSRLALAVMDQAASEFTDLRARMSSLERREELDAQDMLRAHVLARIVVDAWRSAGCSLDSWRELQISLHEELASLVEEAYHETNRWLVEQGVLPDVDLHPYIKRSRHAPTQQAGFPAALAIQATARARVSVRPRGRGRGRAPATGRGRGMARVRRWLRRRRRRHIGPRHRSGCRAHHQFGCRPQFELGLLGRLACRGLGRWQFPGPRRRRRRNPHDDPRGAAGAQRRAFRGGARPAEPAGRPPPAVLQRHQPRAQAVARAGPGHRPGAAGHPPARRASTKRAGEPTVTTPALLEELHQRKQALKQSAATPEERATIEIVALLFQSILTEDRIPASVRVWFARLQMPVLRVAVTEPDFFATVDHPARRLIDRMGACVMGFDSSTRSVGDALEKEIKRVVQVVEAYPDTGRRVFQTVLTEFEKFLEHYFSNENEATRKGVSLAQQVEQRETMAIQYTIELRRMLNEMPVQESVRAFLFQVWADVLATTAVRYGAQSDETRAMKRAASDLIWSASAKVTREERAEVIRRLTPLLKTLRDGMSSAGMDPARQDEHIQILNNSLAAAFTAKAPVIPHERLQELAERLESLEELLPDAADVTIDDSIVFDLSGHESSELEVVSEGGSMPTPAMIAWARELQVGGWYMLDYRGRNEAVQLAWLGLRKQLSMFVTAAGSLRAVPAAAAGVLPAGRAAAAGAGRKPERARHAQRAGQAGRRPVPSAELTHPRSGCGASLKAEPPAARQSRVCGVCLTGRAGVARASVDQALFRGDEEFVEDQRVGLFAQAPEDHQHDDLQVVQFHRSVADGGGPVDHHLAHRRRQHAGRFEKADEADGFVAEQVALGVGIDAQALLRPGGRRTTRRWWPGRPATSARPGSRRFRSRPQTTSWTAAGGSGRRPGASSFRTGTRALRT